MEFSFGATDALDYKKNMECKERKQDELVDVNSTNSNGNGDLGSTANAVIGYGQKFKISIDNPVSHVIDDGPVTAYVASKLAQDKVTEMIKNIVCDGFTNELNESNENKSIRKKCISDSGGYKFKPSLNEDEVKKIRSIRVFVVKEKIAVTELKAKFKRNIHMNLVIQLIPKPLLKLFAIDLLNNNEMSFNNDKDPLVLGINVIEFGIDWNDKQLFYRLKEGRKGNYPIFQNADKPMNTPIRDGFKPINVQDHANIIHW